MMCLDDLWTNQWLKTKHIDGLEVKKKKMEMEMKMKMRKMEFTVVFIEGERERAWDHNRKNVRR